MKTFRSAEYKRFAINLCVSLTATVLFLIFLEVVLRGYHAAGRFFSKTDTNQVQSVTETTQVKSVPLQIVTNSVIIYDLNSEHPAISSQGL